MSSDQAFLLLVFSWVVSYGLVGYVFTSSTNKSKNTYWLLAGISGFFAIIAYVCYYFFFLPFYG